MIFKLFTYQEWLASSSWMGDGCAFLSPVIPHPSFHLHYLNIYITIISPYWEMPPVWQWLHCSLEKKIWKIQKKYTVSLPPLWLWLQAAMKKKLKNQKKILLYSMYIKMYQILKKNIIVFSDFSAFLLIKVTALSNFIFLLYF